jgi:predicted transcriptional regulator
MTETDPWKAPLDGIEVRRPETPVERLRRLADPKTRNVPAQVILEAVAVVVSDLVDEVAKQREQIAEQRAWIDDAARGFLRGSVEDAVKHNRPNPIPTPNRPDQTPQEQRPEAVLGEVPLVPACQLWARGTEHNPHDDCPGHDGK